MNWLRNLIAETIEDIRACSRYRDYLPIVALVVSLISLTISLAFMVHSITRFLSS